MVFAIKFILFVNAAFLILMSLRGVLAMRAEASSNYHACQGAKRH